MAIIESSTIVLRRTSNSKACAVRSNIHTLHPVSVGGACACRARSNGREDLVVVVVVVRTPTPNYLRQASPDRGKYHLITTNYYGFIPDYLVFCVFFTRLPGFHKKCTRLPGVPSRGGQITWFLQNLHQITWSPQSGGTRLPGPLLAIKWTRLPGKTRLPGGAKRGPEYLVSTKKRPDYLGAANWVVQSTWVSPSRLQGDG